MRYRGRAPNVIHESFDGEVIIIDLDTGTYFSVDDVGGEIWTMLHAARSAGEVVDALCARYPAADRAAVERDVGAFLADLLTRRLVVESTDPPRDPPAAPAPATRAYAAPRLVPYTDMQDLLLLDPIHEVDATGWPQRR